METIKKEFTVRDAYDIQTKHIAEWMPKLSINCYTDLLTWVISKNMDVKNTHDVVRGCDLSAFISNWKPIN